MCCLHVKSVEIELFYVIHIYRKYFQPFKQEQKKNSRSWFSLGREVGSIVVDDEQAGAEEDQSEEDREVQKIMDDRRAVKHKILTGNIHNVVELYMFVHVWMSKWSKEYTVHSVVYIDLSCENCESWASDGGTGVGPIRRGGEGCWGGGPATVAQIY